MATGLGWLVNQSFENYLWTSWRGDHVERVKGYFYFHGQKSSYSVVSKIGVKVLVLWGRENLGQ